MRVALFVTCLVDTLYPEVGRAAVGVLERAGVTVEFPSAQTCCGQLHYNAGHADEARLLARRFVDVFDGYDAVVAPSGSCGGHVRRHLVELAGDDHGLAARTWELSQFLVEKLGVTDVGARFEGRVTYHPSCHATRVLGVGEAPKAMLQAVSGLELVELPDAEECCGFGGTFAIKNAAVSEAMLDDKLRAIEETGADVVCACDSSCLMHVGGGLERRGSRVRALHLAELLAG